MFVVNLISSSYHSFQKNLHQGVDASKWPVKDCKVAFEVILDDDGPKNINRCSIKWLFQSGWDFLTQTVNTLALFNNGFNIHTMQQMVSSHDSLLAPYKFLPFLKIPTFNIATHPAVTAAIYKHHRDEGPFTIDNGPGSIYAFILEMLDDTTLTPDNIIFTCSEKQTRFFHQHLTNEFTSKATRKYQPEIHSAVECELKKWRTSDKEINVTDSAHNLVCDAMSRVLLGCPDNDRHIAIAMQTFFEFIAARFAQKDYDLQKLTIARTNFWNRISQSVNNNAGLASILSAKGELDFDQIKMIIFSLLFAGTDSSTQSLIYGIYKCAQDEQLQDKAKLEISEVLEFYKNFDNSLCTPTIIRQIIRESLRMFTPVIGVTRVATETLNMRSSYYGDNVIHTIPKGEHIAPSQNRAARSPLLFPDIPNEFDSERHRTFSPLLSLPWHPFGGARNPCTGSILYNLLAETLFIELLGKYKFTTDIKHEVEQVGSFINKLKEPIYIKLL